MINGKAEKEEPSKGCDAPVSPTNAKCFSLFCRFGFLAIENEGETWEACNDHAGDGAICRIRNGIELVNPGHPSRNCKMLNWASPVTSGQHSRQPIQPHSSWMKTMKTAAVLKI